MTMATEPVTQGAEGTQYTNANAQGASEADANKVGNTFDPETLTTEVKGYVTKQREAAAAEAAAKYADYESHKAAAQEWEGVRNDPRFQKFAESLRQAEQPKPFEISDEQFNAALSDKAQFTALVQQAARTLMEQTVGPELASVKQHNEFQAKVGELQQTVAKFPDFKDLDKRGLIEPIIRKYPSLSFEDAYWLAKKDTLNEEADRRARGIIAGKKAASLERPGTPNTGKGARVNAKNREEAMNMVAEAIRAGRPVPEFDEIGD